MILIEHDQSIVKLWGSYQNSLVGTISTTI